MTRYAWLFVVAGGCASVAAPSPPPSAAFVALSRVPDLDPGLVVFPNSDAPPDGRCGWPATDPVGMTGVSPPSTTCQPLPSPERQRELQQHAEQLWSWQFPEHRVLAANWRCDGLGDALVSVAFEASDGPEGWVVMVEMSQRSDGDFDLTKIRYNHHYGGTNDAGSSGDPYAAVGPGDFEASVGVVEKGRARAVFADVRTALTFRPHEMRPIGGQERWHSQGHARHVMVALRDSAGRGIETTYVGPETQASRGSRVSRQLAADALWSLLRDPGVVQAQRAVPRTTGRIRELFARALHRAGRRGDDFGLYYLPQRYAGMATALRDVRHVPLLLDLLQSDRDDVEMATRRLALNGVALLTGYDARYDERGVPRTMRDATRDVLSRCRVDG